MPARVRPLKRVLPSLRRSIGASCAKPGRARGGPPVAYEAATFCRTLRTGVDPAHVVLPRAMPRFEVDDVQCAALWDYLTQEVRS